MSLFRAAIPDATQPDVTGLKWFKIWEDGLDLEGVWGVTRLYNAAGKVNFTIPSCIPVGQYLLRHEIIALHAASNYPGAQFYVRAFFYGSIHGYKLDIYTCDIIDGVRSVRSHWRGVAPFRTQWTFQAPTLERIRESRSTSTKHQLLRATKFQVFALFDLVLIPVLTVSSQVLTFLHAERWDFDAQYMSTPIKL